MRTNYHIEDLVFQNENLVLYRVQTPDGTSLALVRLRYEDDILASLQEGRFENALRELQSLEHQSLRSILDGGLDPVDSAPWVVIHWVEGTILTDRIKRGPLLTQQEYDRIKDHGSALIEALGPVASTLSFTPESVVTSDADPANLIDTFSIDYHAWFHAFAQDIHPATLSASYQKLADLLTRLRGFTQHTPASLLTSDLAPPTQLSTIANPTSNPASTIAPLPSTSKSSSPLKALLIVGTLLLGIGAGIWALTQRSEPAPAALPQISATPPQETPKTSPPSSVTNTEKTTGLPTRPKNFRFIQIQANDPTLLEKNLGQWVKVSSQITGLDSQGHLILADSSLRAEFPPKCADVSKSSIGNTTTLFGFLQSSTLLKVQDPDDIKITFLKKELYTIEDEFELRNRIGENIDFQGTVGKYRKTKTYHYLALKAEDPSIEIRVHKREFTPAFNEEFIQSLTTKKLKIMGAKISKAGMKLYLVITKKSQLTEIE